MLAYNTSSAIKDAIPCHQPSTNNSTGGEPSIDVGAGPWTADGHGGGRNGHGLLLPIKDRGRGRMKDERSKRTKGKGLSLSKKFLA